MVSEIVMPRLDIKFLFLLFFSVFFIACPARADYFVWRDTKTGLSLTYPDTWKIVNNEQPDDVVTVLAPSGRGHASCRMRVRDDMRYSIFPQQYNKAVQKIDVSTAFWNKYLSEYKEPQLYTTADSAGLGLGYAGTAEAGYWDTVPGPLMQKSALMFASLFNNHLYILECSAQASFYPEWKKDFLNIASSVDFMKGEHELLNGYYRDFMQDPRQRFQNPDGKTLSIY